MLIICLAAVVVIVVCLLALWEIRRSNELVEYYRNLLAELRARLVLAEMDVNEMLARCSGCTSMDDLDDLDDTSVKKKPVKKKGKS